MEQGTIQEVLGLTKYQINELDFHFNQINEMLKDFSEEAIAETGLELKAEKEVIYLECHFNKVNGFANLTRFKKLTKTEYDVYVKSIKND